MGRTEEICRQKDDLADEDHTHHLTPEEIDDYRVIGGFVRTKLVPTQCQSGTDLTSKSIVYLAAVERKKKLNKTNDGRKAILRLGGTGKKYGGILLRESPRRRTQHRLIRET